MRRPPPGRDPPSISTTRSAWSSMSGLVRDDDGRPAGARLVQTPCDPRLGVRVDRARRLDEDEHLGVREQRAREDEPLPLAARERAAALVDGRVEPVGERVEHVLGVRDRDRLADRAVVRARAPTGRARCAACPRRAPDRPR